MERYRESYHFFFFFVLLPGQARPSRVADEASIRHAVGATLSRTMVHVFTLVSGRLYLACRGRQLPFRPIKQLRRLF